MKAKQRAGKDEATEQGNDPKLVNRRWVVEENEAKNSSGSFGIGQVKGPLQLHRRKRSSRTLGARDSRASRCAKGPARTQAVMGMPGDN